MIASLTGKIIEREAPFVVLEAGGVGYEVQLSLPDLAKVNVDQTLKLYIHQIIREDGQFMFGFIDRKQREWFRILIKVNGLGPKLAMAVISVMHPAEIVTCVCSENYKLLTKIPGIGTKLAQRMVVELKDKVKNYQAMLVEHQEGMSVTTLDRQSGVLSLAAATSVAVQEAISALVNLGYKMQQAEQAIGKIKDTETKSCEELIREVLKLNAMQTRLG